MSFVAAFEASDEPRDQIEWIAQEALWELWDEQQMEELTWET